MLDFRQYFTMVSVGSPYAIDGVTDMYECKICGALILRYHHTPTEMDKRKDHYVMHAGGISNRDRILRSKEVTTSPELTAVLDVTGDEEFKLYCADVIDAPSAYRLGEILSTLESALARIHMFEVRAQEDKALLSRTIKAMGGAVA